MDNQQIADAEQNASSAEKSLAKALGKRGIPLVLLVLVVAALLVLFYPYLFVTIHAGERGVLWSRWTGTLTDQIYLEGTQFVWPWNKMTVYDIRYQVAKTRLVLLSSDGLPITVDLTIRYKPSDRLLGRLHDEIGPDYANVIVMPEVATALRKIVSEYSVEDLYKSKFGIIRDQMLEEARVETGRRYVILDDVMFNDIQLPKMVSESIQHKLAEEQQSEEMKYVIAATKQEAERKVIEARGIAQQQALINRTLTDRILTYRSIEATKALAESPNAKIVVMGNGRTPSPPMILGLGDQGSQPGKQQGGGR